MCAQATKIFVNGVWTGIHRRPQELVTTLRKMRREVSFSVAWSCALASRALLELISMRAYDKVSPALLSCLMLQLANESCSPLS